MTEAWGLIIAALITGASTILGLVFRRLRGENQRDHAVVSGKVTAIQETLRDVKKRVDDTGERLTDHLEWHVEAVPKQRPQRKAPPKKKS